MSRFRASNCLLVTLIILSPCRGQTLPNSTQRPPATGTSGAAEPAPAIGHPAPALSLEDVMGRHGADCADGLNWNRLHGHVVVLEFWATWCVPCVGNIAHLNELARTYEDKGVRFISVTDESRAIVERFLRVRPIHGWIGLDRDRSMFSAYGIRPIPRTFVIDQQGRVAAVLAPDELTPSLLDAVLAGKQVTTAPAADIAAPGIDAAALSGPPPGLDPLNETAMLQVMIGPPRDLTFMRWEPGLYVNNAVDLETLLVRLFHLRTPLMIHWDIPKPESRFSFAAKAPNGDEQMLERVSVPAVAAALALSITREDVEHDVYVMTAPHGPGANLEQTGVTSRDHHRFHQVAIDGVLFATEGSFDGLIQALEELLGRPIIDETGWGGCWNWGMHFETGNAQSVIQAARKQLGLVLIPERRKVEMVVVRQAPIDNAPPPAAE